MIVRSVLRLVLLGCLICVCITSPTKRQSGDGEIVKSASDDNEYRAVTLSNGIRCVVVSDRSTELAAVQLEIGVGSMSEETPGLAHFVEHLIFFGSAEYPDGKLYTDYLEDNGGRYNGFTGSTYTGYIFDVNNRFWARAAKMLASFIGEPLFSRDMFETAIEAVDSEYKLGIRSDQRSLIALGMELANPESSDKGFTVGNRKTLNVTDIYEQVIDFHARYYSANLMTLAIVANDTLDSLEGIAEETFGKIPNNDRPTPRYPSLPFPTDDHRFLAKKINYKKKAPGHEIVIFFPINIKNHLSLGYVQYLLEHKGSGSIYQYLLTRGYITTSWSTQIPYEDLEKTSFSVVGGLTEKGVADPLFIVDAVFMYLKAASSNGVDIALWGAMNEIDKLKFRFQDKEHPPNLVYNLCKSMRETNDSRKYLRAPSQAHLDIALENNILKLLRPDNFNIYVGSDSFSDVEAAGNGPQLTKREYYYNTPYYDTNFTEEQLETWRNIKAHPELHLPDPNVLVAKNFQVFEIEEDAGEVPLEIVSRNEDDISIWWFQDKEWKKPKSLVYCKIYPSNVTRDAKTSALEMMLDATFGLIKDKAFYDAEEVSFSPDITLGKDWGVWLFGYSDPDKIEAVIIKMMDALLYRLNFQMDEAHYNATILKPTQRSLDEDDDTSILISFRYISKIINENFVDPVDVIDSAGRITQSDIKDYFDSFLKDVSVTCSAMGNVRKEHAIRYSHIIKNKLLEKGSAISNENRKALTKELGIFKLPPGPSHVIRRRVKNPEAVTSAIIVFFQIGQTKSRGNDSDKPPYTLFALTELLGLIMGSRCFHYLRTEKQLGYSAGCFAFHDESDVTHFAFYVQGSRENAGPFVMNQEINNLIAEQQFVFHHLAGTAEGIKKFEEAKQAMKEAIFVSGKHLRIKDRAWDFMKEIFSSTTDFYKTEKKIAAVDAVTLDEFVDFYEQYIVGDTRRTLSSQVYGANHAMPDTVENGEILIQDIETFRERLTELF